VRRRQFDFGVKGSEAGLRSYLVFLLVIILALIFFISFLILMGGGSFEGKYARRRVRLFDLALALRSSVTAMELATCDAVRTGADRYGHRGPGRRWKISGWDGG